ncbi:MAG: hypothetical protein QMD86_02405 [Patescibacteria group bacterium]|nr:hypothetical protein [Patescibacteria group bacterium]
MNVIKTKEPVDLEKSELKNAQNLIIMTHNDIDIDAQAAQKIADILYEDFNIKSFCVNIRDICKQNTLFVINSILSAKNMNVLVVCLNMKNDNISGECILKKINKPVIYVQPAEFAGDLIKGFDSRVINLVRPASQAVIGYFFNGKK